MKTDWNQIQKCELDYWMKVDNTRGLKKFSKKIYSVLFKEFDFIDISKNNRILDIGCAANTVFLLIKNGERVAIEPLINEIKKKFTLPNGVKYINQPIENFYSNKKFNIIFTLNCIDHMNDIEKATRNIKALLDKNGYLIITLNCHNYEIIKKYFNFFRGYVDELHPFHFLKEDIINLFQPFKLLKLKRIDYLRPEKNIYALEPEKISKRLQLWRLPILIIKFPIWLVSKFIPYYANHGNSIYSTYLFVFQRGSK